MANTRCVCCAPHGRSGVRPERRVHKEAVREALIILWEASDRGDVVVPFGVEA